MVGVIDPGHYFLNSGEPEGFCRYGYTSLPQSSAQGENRLCSQCWGWRGSASGLGMAGGCCSDLLFASGYFTPHTFREQRTVPCFSCLLNVTEMTKKRKDAWKLENPEIRQDYITLSWWKPMNSDCSESERGMRPLWWEVIRVSSSVLACLNALMIQYQSKIIHQTSLGLPRSGKSWGILWYLFLIPSSSAFVLLIHAVQINQTATPGCLHTASYLPSATVPEFSNLLLWKHSRIAYSMVSWLPYDSRIFTDIKDTIAFSAALGKC